MQDYMCTYKINHGILYANAMHRFEKKKLHIRDSHFRIPDV